MRPSLFLAVLAAANGVPASRIPNTDYIDTAASDVSLYLTKLVPVAKDVLRNQLAGPSIEAGAHLPLLSSSPLLDVDFVCFITQPGVVITLIPEEGCPDYLIYWLRDACLAHYAWIAEL